MFIKYQKIVRDDSGAIISGSASLLNISYAPNKDGNRKKSHSHQSVVERLGKVIWIDENDRNQAIFHSPSRGLVFYNLKTDEFVPVDAADPRLSGTQHEYQPARIHTNFGSFYLLFSEMEKTPYMQILRVAFKDRVLYKKVLAHLAHGCLKNGSSIKCGEFLARSCLSYIVDGIPVSTLDCDTAYFRALSDDNVKVSYFRSVVTEMRKNHPEFGNCCYVDSTPLPGEAENNPFNAVSSHGTDGTVVQSRLVLILDIQTHIPVWFEIIPSNILDKSTILSITSDVQATLGISIDMYDLDAGYAREELFGLFNRNNSTRTDSEGTVHDHTVLIRMPATNGYPRDELYIQNKQFFYDPDYEFDYEHHTFFGVRQQINLFDHPEYAFIYVDKTQAESLLRKWRSTHLDEWGRLSKTAKEWYMVKDGFFILVGNKDQSPKEAIVEYRGRAAIEGFFRDGKTFLQILPISKWTKETVIGKILHDVIETTIYRDFRKQVAPAGMSMSGLLTCLDSWECVRISEHLLEIKTPNLQVRECLEKLGYTTPAHMRLDDLRGEILEGVTMARQPITVRKHRNIAKGNPPISPEEKREAREKERREREQKKAEAKAQKAKERAEARAKSNEARAQANTTTLQGEGSIINKDGSPRKKPGVPVGYKRGKFNKDGSLRQKPGPKRKSESIIS